MLKKESKRTKVTSSIFSIHFCFSEGCKFNCIENKRRTGIWVGKKTIFWLVCNWRSFICNLEFCFSVLWMPNDRKNHLLFIYFFPVPSHDGNEVLVWSTVIQRKTENQVSYNVRIHTIEENPNRYPLIT